MVVIDEVLVDAKKLKENVKRTVKNSNGLMHLEKITSDVTKIFADLKEHLETLSWEQELLTWDEKTLKSKFPKNALISANASVTSKDSTNKSEKSQSPGSSANPSKTQNNQNQKPRSTSPAKAPNNAQKPIPVMKTQNSTASAVQKSLVSPSDQLQYFRTIVDKAKRARKTFTVCGNFQSIRRSLLSRGWIERIRIYPSTFDKDFWRSLEDKTVYELLDGTTNRDYGYSYRRMLLSKLLGNHQVDFFWDTANDAFKINNDKVKLTYINRFRRNVFTYTSKQGLCEGVKTAYWYQRPGVSKIRHPRAFSLGNDSDIKEFVDNYRITAAISLLKWIVATYEEKVMKLISSAGKIPIWSFHFALTECYKYELTLKHLDIDEPPKEAEDYEWHRFLQCFYQLVHVTNHFREDEADSLNTEALVFKSKIMLKRIKDYNPHLDMDGMLNMWILKPICGSRGIGINVCQTLDFIMKTIMENRSKKYVVQKYIEKPLLIYKTKFDIRQWFLISSTIPLTIWIYKVCYLRFSSQTYNLRKLHKAIHLTNNAVQSQFKSVERDRELPEDNMWDLQRFLKYLDSIGHTNVWNKSIYPGMKESITAAIIMNQENLDYRRNTFELYGADFMLTEDFTPWLIEINSRPALYASTKVTGRLCPMVLEDVIKVIIDRARNPTASVGNFELLYKEKSNIFPVNAKEDLCLKGIPLPKNFFEPPPDGFDSDLSSTVVNLGAASSKASSVMSRSHKDVSQSITSAKNAIQSVSKEMKSTLELLLEVINKEKLRRQEAKKGTSKENSCASDANAAVSFIKSLKKEMDQKKATKEADVASSSKGNASVPKVKSSNVPPMKILPQNKSTASAIVTSNNKTPVSQIVTPNNKSPVSKIVTPNNKPPAKKNIVKATNDKQFSDVFEKIVKIATVGIKAPQKKNAKDALETDGDKNKPMIKTEIPPKIDFQLITKNIPSNIGHIVYNKLGNR